MWREKCGGKKSTMCGGRSVQQTSYIICHSWRCIEEKKYVEGEKYNMWREKCTTDEYMYMYT